MPLFTLTMAATVLAQQLEHSRAIDASQPGSSRFIMLPSAADLMDSLCRAEGPDREIHEEDFSKHSREAMALYQRALRQYLHELPWVQASRGAWHRWWDDFDRQQERFWRMWRARFGKLLEQHMQTIWMNSYSRRLQQTIPLSGSPPIFLAHQFGDVAIHGSMETAAYLVAEIKVIATSKADAEGYAGEIAFEVTPQDSAIKVIALLPELRPKTVAGTSIVIQLELPRECPLQVENSFGDVRAQGLINGLKAETSHGSLHVQQCAGDLYLFNRQGEIVVSQADGGLRAETSFGPIVVSGVRGDVFARNEFGTVSIKGVSGAVEVENSAGLIETANIDGDVTVNNHLGRVAVQGVTGNLTVDNAGSPVSIADVLGETHIENERGEIRAEKLGGNVVIMSRSGNVDLILDEVRQNLYRLDASFGVVRVNLPPSPSALIRAQALYGTIDSDFPLEIKRVGAAQLAQGKLGQGNANIQLDGENSNIYLISSER